MRRWIRHSGGSQAAFLLAGLELHWFAIFCRITLKTLYTGDLVILLTGGWVWASQIQNAQTAASKFQLCYHVLFVERNRDCSAIWSQDWL